MKILVLNSGSSSLKYQVIDMENNETIAKGYFERIGQPNSFLSHKVHGRKHKFEIEAKDHEEAISFVLNRLTNDHYGVIKSLDELEAIGHRIVHGGEKFSDAVLITDEVIEEIKKCSDLAPLHNPAAVLGIEACKKVVPNMKMVAVFDTAFHQTIPKERYIYPVPYKYYEKYGVRKYGFHGTSHQYVANRVCQMLGKDINNARSEIDLAVFERPLRDRRRADVHDGPRRRHGVRLAGYDRSHRRHQPRGHRVDVGAERANYPITDFTSKDAKWAEKYHVWMMDWDEKYIRIYLDDVLLNETDLSTTYNKGDHGAGEGGYINPYSNDLEGFGQLMMLNLAIGGSNGRPIEATFPLEYCVDYVRVYQKK